MRINGELNKWQYGITFGRCPIHMRGFNPYIAFWFLKLIHFPKMGEVIKKCCYKGILVNKVFSPIIIMRRKSFKIFGKCFGIDYPIKIGKYGQS